MPKAGKINVFGKRRVDQVQQSLAVLLNPSLLLS